MSGHATTYYTGLAPFRRLFTAGVPVLMYHKLGPRPPGVRLKGLYVSRARFERQLAELTAAGFHSTTLDALVGSADAARVPAAASASARRFVITFDDGFRNVLDPALDVLARHESRAIQYVVAGRIGGTNDWEMREGERPEPLLDAEELRRWLAAGHAIGSHSMTHPFLSRIPEAAAREEIVASRRRLEDQFGVAVEHFCYPFGDWSPRVRDLVAEAGYRSAVTTTFGVHAPGDDPLAIRRLMARYPSLNWRSLVSRWAFLARR